MIYFLLIIILLIIMYRFHSSNNLILYSIARIDDSHAVPFNFSIKYIIKLYLLYN